MVRMGAMGRFSEDLLRRLIVTHRMGWFLPFQSRPIDTGSLDLNLGDNVLNRDGSLARLLHVVIDRPIHKLPILSLSLNVKSRNIR